MSGNAARRNNDQQHMQVEVVERTDALGAWTVEAIDDEGSIYQAVFAGPESYDRAIEYARFKYGV